MSPVSSTKAVNDTSVMMRLLVTILAIQPQHVWGWTTLSHLAADRLPRQNTALASVVGEGSLSSAQKDEKEDQSTGISPKIPEESRRQLLRGGCAAFAASLTSVQWSTFADAYTDDESRRIGIFEKTASAVVFIDTFTERRDAFTTNIMEVPLGSGSGFVWDKEGHIITNYHVVRNAKAAQVAILVNAKEAARSVEPVLPVSGSAIVPVRTSSMRPNSSFGSGNIVQKVYLATVVGVDPAKDIAVLKVDAPASLLSPIAKGSSSGLKVGQQALAIGNPFGLDHTLTAGIISGIGREVKSPIGRPITNVIQTDAAINPGNSGGPLLDSSGLLIGMNTAIYSPSGGSAGIGFAIPIDTVKFIVETLLRDGKVVRPVIGISFLESKQAQTLGITSGVLILTVPEGSAAALAGLKGTRRTESGMVEIGDIIVKVGDKQISTESDLFQALDDYKPGDSVVLTVNRLVAVFDEMKVKELALRVTLQPSNEVEKTMQQYSYPTP